jgi:hypothetical protein
MLKVIPEMHRAFDIYILIDNNYIA